MRPTNVVLRVGSYDEERRLLERVERVSKETTRLLIRLVQVVDDEDDRLILRVRVQQRRDRRRKGRQIDVARRAPELGR